MNLKEQYNLDELKNWSAELVFERVEKLIEERDDICTCEECILDLVAFTLNHVTPMYGKSLLKPLHPNRIKERRIQIEIDRALRAGLKRIAKNPHHE